jgi:hypothetical protein
MSSNDKSSRQAEIGLGKPPNPTSERRFVSAPNSTPNFAITTVDAVLGSAAKKRKGLPLTPDNADQVFASSFDFEKLSKSFPFEIDKEMLYEILMSCVIDPNVCPLDRYIAGC